jgi:hypothetical protein
MAFARFMASPFGRGLRVLLGAILIVGGYSMHDTGGLVLLVVGLIPLATGLFDWCLFAPLFGFPIPGSAIRKMH